MMTNERKSVVWLGAGALVAGLLPVLLYWLLLGRVDAWTALQAGQAPAFHPSSVFEQWVVIVTGFGVKPVYTVLSLIVIVRLWRQGAPDLVALRRGLIAFWLGENACAIDYLVFHGDSVLWEYFHNLGMVACFSYAAFAVFEGIDQRLIKLSSLKDRCAALGLCRACVKHDPGAPCGLRRVFTMLIPVSIAVAIMPLCADLKLTAYDIDVLGTRVRYAETLSDQLFEIRYCPYLAVVLMAASWLVLLFKRKEPVPLAKVLFAAGLGPLSFGLMRLFLGAVYRENLIWSNAWEEITELLFVVATAWVLWIFRQGLFSMTQDPGKKIP
jgi:hypothetical protein